LPGTDDRLIGLGDEFIDQRRGRLAPLKVRLDGGQRNLRQHEGGAAKLRWASAAESLPREALEAGLDPLRLSAHAAFER
jgi:hypothetical protein